MFRFCKRNFFLRREEFSLFYGSEKSFKSIGSGLFPPRAELLTFQSVLSVKVCLWAITFSVWKENISSVPAPTFFIGKGLLENVLYLLKTSRTGATGSVAIYCQIQDTLSIWPIHSSQTGTITSGQSQPGSNAKEVVLYIPKNSRIGVS